MSFQAWMEQQCCLMHYSSIAINRSGSEQNGLYRVHDGMVDHYGTTDGLSGNSVGPFFEDHEGNIWVLTAGGLDMFRDTPVVNYSMREGLSASTYSILALRDDSLWIGNEGAVDILKGGRHSLLAGKELSDLLSNPCSRTTTALFGSGPVAI